MIHNSNPTLLLDHSRESTRSLPSRPPQRPEKIVLQQNWLTDIRPAKTPIPRTPPPGRARSRSAQETSSGSLLAAPRPDEFEFAQRLSFRGERATIGLRSPAPKPGNLNLPAIQDKQGRQGQAKSTPMNIELFPAPPPEFEEVIRTHAHKDRRFVVIKLELSVINYES